jgi:hypothetical protein
MAGYERGNPVHLTAKDNKEEIIRILMSSFFNQQHGKNNPVIRKIRCTKC